MQKSKNFYNFGDQNTGTWTTEGVLHFPKLTTPEAYSMHAGNPDAKKYYSAAIHVPKAIAFQWIQQYLWPEMQAALAQVYDKGLVKMFVPGFDDLTMNVPQGFKWPWKDGDMAGKDGAPLDAGHIIFNCSRVSTSVNGTPRPAPKVWVMNGDSYREVTNPAEILSDVYAGSVVRFNVFPNVYNQGGGLGLALTLAGVLKMRDGNRIGGGGGNVNTEAAMAGLGLKPLAEVAPPGLDDL